MMVFRERLKELRRLKGITQMQLADIIGTNNSSISDWECGRTEPSVEAIIKLALYFDVTSDYLLGIEDESGVRLKEYVR